MGLVSRTVIMSAEMGVPDKYNASYSNAAHQKTQTLSSVSQSVSQLFTRNIFDYVGRTVGSG